MLYIPRTQHERALLALAVVIDETYPPQMASATTYALLRQHYTDLPVEIINPMFMVDVALDEIVFARVTLHQALRTVNARVGNRVGLTPDGRLIIRQATLDDAIRAVPIHNRLKAQE